MDDETILIKSTHQVVSPFRPHSPSFQAEASLGNRILADQILVPDTQPKSSSELGVTLDGYTPHLKQYDDDVLYRVACKYDVIHRVAFNQVLF